MEPQHIRRTFANINNLPTKAINPIMGEITQKEKEKLTPATVDYAENPHPEQS